ncbi:phage tail tape measure protein [Brachybacterium alimentarium]|uniref:phage tail tape measure protein n=1 Tax=Brachybacterium alimentarium TaxID=47845 RepID=UPI003FCF0DBC
MADRSVKVNLEAKVDGFVSGMRTAQKATVDFTKRAHEAGGKAFDWVDKHKASINDLSNAALGMGAGLVAGAGLAAKAAMDWESAWTGVEKTVDGTDEQMASLEQGLRNMAKSLPATHAEIAAVAEAAGQLGIATPNIESFTRVMINMGEATNLSAEEAATSLARFMNVMGTSQADVGKLGATIVGLGNNFATTESEIVAMGQRLSGAAAQAGLTEGEVLGLAAAMSSVGIEAEAGGSAMSQTMKRIGKAVDEGGESLDLFAQVSGMSAQEFAQAWQSDPATALDTFITGLSSVEEQGMTTNGVLTELGITGIRESDALLRLSAAAGMTAEAMSQGNSEFEQGTALIEEASKRYQTAESRLAMLRNTIVDVGIDVGGAIAPALGDAADKVSYLVERFQDLPDAAKQALGFGAGLAGISLLAVGALGKTVTAVSDVRLAMKNLGIVADTTGKKLKLMGATSAVGIAITALASAIGFFVGKAAEADARADALIDTFDELTGAATAETSMLITDQMNESLQAGDWKLLDQIGVSYTDMMDAVVNGGEDAIDVRKRLLEVTQTGSKAERDAAREALQVIDEVGGAYQDTAAEAEYYAETQANVATETGVSAEAQATLDAALEETGVTLEGVVEDMQTFLDLLFETGLATMSARDAAAAHEEAIAGVGDTVKEINENLGGLSSALNDSKSDFDLTTEAGRAANGAFQDVAKSGMDSAKAMAENGASQEELQKSLSGTYDDLIAAAGQFNITGDAADDLAREVLGIPDGVDIDTWMSDAAEQQARDTQSAISNIDRYINIVTQYTTRGTRPPVGSLGAPIPIAANADGNVWESPSRIKAFANGSENHVAQIASPGAMRLWAEPETGGEAYIPLAQSKRARSERILADVASRFGMGVQRFADGGMVMPYEPRRTPATKGGGDASFSPVFHNYNTDAVRATREQVAQFGQVIDSMAVTLPGG